MDYPWFEVERCRFILKWLYCTYTLYAVPRVATPRILVALHKT